MILITPREKNLKHGGTEKTEKGRIGMDGNVVVHVGCKGTIGVGNSSDLCFLCASVFQLLKIKN